jgi:hypothetical protein
MKTRTSIILTLMLLFTACVPITLPDPASGDAPSGGDAPGGVITSNSGDPAQPGLDPNNPVLGPTVGVAISDGNATPAPSGDADPAVGAPPRGETDPAEPVNVPAITWNAAATQVVIRGTYCCGFTTPTYVTNYIPDFVIWGDGRYIWVQTLESGARNAYEGRLTAEEVHDLISRLVQDGFFDWEDRYEDFSVTDLPDRCIAVSLQEITKSVCEYHQGAPEAFHRLYAFFASGAGRDGVPFVPPAAFLTAVKFDADFVTPTIVWNAESPDFGGIGEAGRWVEGEALARLWEAMNTQPWMPTVEYRGAFYIFTLQVPGLSLQEPPAR